MIFKKNLINAALFWVASGAQSAFYFLMLINLLIVGFIGVWALVSPDNTPLFQKVFGFLFRVMFVFYGLFFGLGFASGTVLKIEREKNRLLKNKNNPDNIDADTPKPKNENPTKQAITEVKADPTILEYRIDMIEKGVSEFKVLSFWVWGIIVGFICALACLHLK